MWPFRKKSKSASQWNIRDIATTTCWARAGKFMAAYDAYRSSTPQIAARVQAEIFDTMPRERLIDRMVDIFAREEFSLFEDVCDGTQEAFA